LGESRSCIVSSSWDQLLSENIKSEVASLLSDFRTFRNDVISHRYIWDPPLGLGTRSLTTELPCSILESPQQTACSDSTCTSRPNSPISGSTPYSSWQLAIVRKVLCRMQPARTFSPSSHSSIPASPQNSSKPGNDANGSANDPGYDSGYGSDNDPSSDGNNWKLSRRAEKQAYLGHL
jgi:hypothetical protein